MKPRLAIGAGGRCPAARPRSLVLTAGVALLWCLIGGAASARASSSPVDRAEVAVAAMTEDEKLSLVLGYFGAPRPDRGYLPPPEARSASAGYVPGVPRLGIPPQWETDAGIGVASQGNAGAVRARTALPSGLATAATWDPAVAESGGAMIGAEARSSGFNVMLAGGVNLARDPRNGRTFEYAGEDPLLAGTMVGAQIRGIQSNHIIATLKHFALNDQETGRFVLSARIDEAAARTSDLLAFEIALQQGDPGAVMCAYNRVNAIFSCENEWLLNRVLKHDWRYRYYVMSDWGAVHSAAPAVNAGLDQESAGTAFDAAAFFGAPLRHDILNGAVSPTRINDMATRIVRALFDKGVVDHPVIPGPIDAAAHAAVSQRDAEAAMVLLRNDNALLPIRQSIRRIAVIGSHADVGVLSGGGSSQVYPPGGIAVPGLGPAGFPGPMVYDASSPLLALRSHIPGSDIGFDDGTDPSRAAALAAKADVAIVVAHQWAAESEDVSLTLPDAQDALIDAVAAANSDSVVVLETGGPVLMPWENRVGAILEAWYPGSAGGEAIARVLLGEVDAPGRLPITFPRSEDQLPRPHLDGDPAHSDAPFDVVYGEGAAVGYKWFDRQKLSPLFAFGFGLSYTTFQTEHLEARPRRDGIDISFDIRNTGSRDGWAVPQIYVGADDDIFEAPKRLGGWRKSALAPGETRHVDITIPAHMLATWDQLTQHWIIKRGSYRIMLGASSDDITASVKLRLPTQVITDR